MNRIYLPARSADQWAQLLAEPDKQWRTGYSARSLAHCWQDADGFPREVRGAFGAAPALADLEFLFGIPEHQVHLPGGSRPSQTDLWVLAKGRNGLASIAVEGKVAEPFGPTIGEWLHDASKGKHERLSYLQAELGFASQPSSALRYQLLHRTTSALIEARRFGAAHAVLLVHSFSPQKLWFSDYAAFADAIGARAMLDAVVPARRVSSGVSLWVGWVCGDPTFLRR